VDDTWAGQACEVRASAAALVAAGRHATLVQRIEAIPLEARARDPWLGYWLGRCRLALRIAGARTLLAAAFSDFERAGDAEGALASCACLLGSSVSPEQTSRWTEAAERIAAAHRRPGDPAAGARVFVKEGIDGSRSTPAPHPFG
jgi:hypothetical protein